MEETKIDVSVIIPVYNQTDKLRKCIQGFQEQEFTTDIKWEIIIADDGSEDKIQDDCIIMSVLSQFNIPINVINSEHCGRAKIRNLAIGEARGRVLIFCDGDRIPCKDYIQRHFDVINKHEKVVSIGNPMDFFGREFLFDERINIQSRNTNYFNCISSIFTVHIDESTLTTSSKLAWLALLIGNSAIRKKDLVNIGAFDEDFYAWGFEHFELGYRLQKLNYRFMLSRDIINYHLVHKHNATEMQEGFKKSIDIISNKHSEINVKELISFFCGDISIAEYQKAVNDKDIVDANKRIVNSPWRER